MRYASRGVMAAGLWIAALGLTSCGLLSREPSPEQAKRTETVSSEAADALVPVEGQGVVFWLNEFRLMDPIVFTPGDGVIAGVPTDLFVQSAQRSPTVVASLKALEVSPEQADVSDWFRAACAVRPSELNSDEAYFWIPEAGFEDPGMRSFIDWPTHSKVSLNANSLPLLVHTEAFDCGQPAPLVSRSGRQPFLAIRDEASKAFTAAYWSESARAWNSQWGSMAKLGRTIEHSRGKIYLGWDFRSVSAPEAQLLEPGHQTRYHVYTVELSVSLDLNTEELSELKIGVFSENAKALALIPELVDEHSRRPAISLVYLPRIVALGRLSDEYGWLITDSAMRTETLRLSALVGLDRSGERPSSLDAQFWVEWKTKEGWFFRPRPYRQESEPVTISLPPPPSSEAPR